MVIAGAHPLAALPTSSQEPPLVEFWELFIASWARGILKLPRITTFCTLGAIFGRFGVGSADNDDTKLPEETPAFRSRRCFLLASDPALGCRKLRTIKHRVRWFKKDGETFNNVVDGLKHIYKTKLLPLEENHHFHEFHSPKLNDPDFEAKPLILLMGQYSTGKTTLIKYILESDFPGMRIGPEPTTDRFMAIMYDEKTGVIPGNALVVDPKKPFAPLAKYGNAFLTKFQCSTLNNAILKGVSLVDTPGILSGEKQRVDRGYDFTGVLEWFAERVDRIILLFDAHKLDISDEFRRSIEALRGHDEKIKIVLNKADMVDHQSLMRIYGSLMWSLGKVFNTPEVARVYVGSFWDQSLRNSVNRQLFEDEEQDLFKDIQSLPRNSALRKLNDLNKRARLAKVHAHIIDALKREMPVVFGKSTKKEALISNLKIIFEKLQKDLQISPGDFPEVRKMQAQLQDFDFDQLRRIEPSQMKAVDDMLATDITKLMMLIHEEEEEGSTDIKDLQAGVFTQTVDTKTPFSYKSGEGFGAGKGDVEWIIQEKMEDYDKIFKTLNPDASGRLTRQAAKAELLKSKLSGHILSKIYVLADVDDDGLLDREEFAVAKYVLELKQQGFDLPQELPEHLVPPSKRDLRRL